MATRDLTLEDVRLFLSDYSMTELMLTEGSKVYAKFLEVGEGEVSDDSNTEEIVAENNLKVMSDYDILTNKTMTSIYDGLFAEYATPLGIDKSVGVAQIQGESLSMLLVKPPMTEGYMIMIKRVINMEQ